MDLDRQKLTGSFYTESKVAESVVNWAIRNKNDHVIEPSFGNGIFIDKSFKRFGTLGASKPLITAVEIQADVANYVRCRYPAEMLDVRTADFLSLNFDDQFDVVLGNPPYVSIRNVPLEQRETAQQVISCNKVQCPNNGSLWFPFILKAITALKKNGRLAFVLPFEITYARYAFGMLKILAKSFSELTICRIYEDFFPNVDVETVLLFADGKGGETDYINYEIYNTIDDLLLKQAFQQERIALEDILDRKKPFISAVLSAPQEQILERLREKKHIRPILESCKFKIGYVSADKKYFHPKHDVVAQFLLPDENLLPTILNAKEVNGGTGIGIEVNKGECTSRLYIPRTISEGDRLYIKSGEMLGVQKRYKCRLRKPWYITPNIEIPDVILSVFGDKPKMIANKGNYVVSNSLLGGYLNNTTTEQLLCRWYNSLTLLSIELNVHSLGGGSFVVIPGEADRLEIIADIPRDKVPGIFSQLNNSAIESGIEATYTLGDELVLKGIFDFSNKDIISIREAIEKLRSWRNPVYRRGRII